MRVIIHFFHHRFVSPLKQFIYDSRFIGILLLICTSISLLLSNIPATNLSYLHLFEFSFSGHQDSLFFIGQLSFPNTILLCINDFLMAFFFFLAGMEIKRELIEGELSSFSKAILPVVAAIGGMFAPAIIYAIINHHSNFQSGWGIPMATDIAFTLGVASLLGNRVPLSLKIFVTALAIIDDLGAIIIIALFYGVAVHPYFLLFSLILVALILLLNKLLNKFGFLQFTLGILLWYCLFHSGIHATIAGVILAFCVPAKQLRQFERHLHIPVYFIILPLFVLANTAIPIPHNCFHYLDSSLGWGILAGLFLGKPIGICLAVFVMYKLKWASLPTDTSKLQFLGASVLCGIGFTMSIFVTTLAFDNIIAINTGKIAILLASTLSMFLGYLLLRIKGSSK